MHQVGCEYKAMKHEQVDVKVPLQIASSCIVRTETCVATYYPWDAGVLMVYANGIMIWEGWFRAIA